MSAPNTDPKVEEKRHRPVMIALRVMIAAAVLFLLGFVVIQMTAGDEGITEGEEASPAVE